MAQSRLEKIGTIFTRVSGLLRSGAMKTEDKPIWYDVYAAFPPKLEPRFDRPATNVPIRNIFYEEDVVRAKYHKDSRPNETINLIDTRRETQTQQFIKIYNNLKSQGALDDTKIYETAQDLLAEQRQQARTEAAAQDSSETEFVSANSSLLSDFKEAKEAAIQNENKASYTNATKPKESNITSGGSGNINISNLFKD